MSGQIVHNPFMFNKITFAEYPPGYRRAINLELNGTFSNGQDQQEGEILMNIDALRKYNSNLEKVILMYLMLVKPKINRVKNYLIGHRLFRQCRRIMAANTIIESILNIQG